MCKQLPKIYSKDSFMYPVILFNINSSVACCIAPLWWLWTCYGAIKIVVLLLLLLLLTYQHSQLSFKFSAVNEPSFYVPPKTNTSTASISHTTARVAVCQPHMHQWSSGQCAGLPFWRRRRRRRRRRRTLCTDLEVCCVGAHPSRCFEPERVKSNQASIHHKLAGWPAQIIAGTFSQLCQYTNSPGYRAYCYAKLAVSSLAVAVTIASTHFT